VENGLEICLVRKPHLIEHEDGHKVRCWLYEDHPDMEPDGA
jgi:hypothetical protein